MKSTGIIRRIDDLGRVVIPKEIRRNLRIREGDPLEVYIEDDKIIYKKYSPIGEINEIAYSYAEVLESVSCHSVLITDRDCIVAVAGVSKREYIERIISHELEDIMETRRTYQYDKDSLVHPVRELPRVASVVCPIISQGELYGSVVLLADDRYTTPSDVELKLAQYTASLIGSQFSEY